jgi:hypothetical protein
LIFGTGCSDKHAVQVESWQMGEVFSPTSRGNIYLLPSVSADDPAEITVYLNNKKDLDLALSFEDSVIPAGREIAVRQVEKDKAVISVLNAEHGDQFKLILNMKSGDGKKTYQPYAYLPLLICDADAPINPVSTSTSGELLSYSGAPSGTDGEI